MLGVTLSIVIPAVLIAYGVWLAVRMIRNRKRGCGYSGGCGSCPYAGNCSREDPRPRGKERRDA